MKIIEYQKPTGKYHKGAQIYERCLPEEATHVIIDDDWKRTVKSFKRIPVLWYNLSMEIYLNTDKNIKELGYSFQNFPTVQDIKTADKLYADCVDELIDLVARKQHAKSK